MGNLIWIPAATKPPAETAVLVTAVSQWYKQPLVYRAMWVPPLTFRDDGNFQGDSDYDEATDESYWPEGWYEWNAHEETHWACNDEVIAWVPLPEPYQHAQEK